MIKNETSGMESVSVRGVTLKEDLAAVSLVGVPNTKGLAARIFSDIARKQVLVDDIVQSISDSGRLANIGFTVSSSDLSEARAMCDDLAGELGIASVEVDEGVSKVSVIGVGMRSHAGVAATMFEALSKAEINIEDISTSEIVISCIVRKEEGPRAARALHEAFELDKIDAGGKPV